MKKTIRSFFTAAISLATLLITGSALSATVTDAKWGNMGDNIVPTPGVATKVDQGGYSGFTLNFSANDNLSHKEIGATGTVKVKQITFVRRGSGTQAQPTTVRLTQGNKTADGTVTLNSANIVIYGNQWPGNTGNKWTRSGYYVATFTSDVEFDVSTDISLAFLGSNGSSFSAGISMIQPNNSVLKNGTYSPAIEIIGDYTPSSSGMATATIKSSEGMIGWDDIDFGDVTLDASVAVEITVDDDAGRDVYVLQGENPIVAKSIKFIRGTGSHGVGFTTTGSYAGGKITSEVPLAVTAEVVIEVDSGNNDLTYSYIGAATSTIFPLTCGGTLEIHGGSSASPISISKDFNKLTLGAGTFVKYDDKGTARLYDITGSGATSVFTIARNGNGAPGFTNGSNKFNNVIVESVATGNNSLWFEHTKPVSDTVGLKLTGNIKISDDTPDPVVVRSITGSGTLDRNGSLGLSIKNMEDADFAGTSTFGLTVLGSSFVQTFSGAYTQPLTIAEGGKVKLTGSANPSSVTMGAGASLARDGDGTIASMTVNGAVTIDVVSGTLTISAISGSGTITKTGSGTLNLPSGCTSAVTLSGGLINANTACTVTIDNINVDLTACNMPVGWTIDASSVGTILLKNGFSGLIAKATSKPAGVVFKAGDTDITANVELSGEYLSYSNLIIDTDKNWSDLWNDDEPTGEASIKVAGNHALTIDRNPTCSEIALVGSGDLAISVAAGCTAVPAINVAGLDGDLTITTAIGIDVNYGANMLTYNYTGATEDSAEIVGTGAFVKGETGALTIEGEAFAPSEVTVSAGALAFAGEVPEMTLAAGVTLVPVAGGIKVTTTYTQSGALTINGAKIEAAGVARSLLLEIPEGNTLANYTVTGLTAAYITQLVGDNAIYAMDKATLDFYARWANAPAILTWKGASAAFHTGLFELFDKDNCEPTTTVYTGNTSSGTIIPGQTEVINTSWHIWSYQTNFKSVAPGYVLRFEGGKGYVGTNIDATFAPFDIGGILVEKGATGFGLSGNGRKFALGDPAGVAETWTVINENFTIDRDASTAQSGNEHVTLRGIVNIEIAAEKTLTFNDNDGKNGITTTDGTMLKMHGEGKMTTKVLVATGAVTLDYSDLALERATPFIDGDLTISAETKFRFPAGLAVNARYQLCSGTLTGGAERAATIYVGREEKDVTLHFDGNAVYYTEATVLNYTTEASISTILNEAGAATTAIVNFTGTTPTLTVDAAVTIPLEVRASSATSFTLAKGSEYTVTDADIEKLAINTDGVAKLVYHDLAIIPTSAPAAGKTYRWEGTVALDAIPYVGAAFAGTIELACPITDLSGDLNVNGAKDGIVFDDGFSYTVGGCISFCGAANSNQILTQRGGTLTATRTGAGGGSCGDTPMIPGRFSGTFVYNLLGGTFNAPNGGIQFAWDGSGTINIGGGDNAATFAAKGIIGSNKNTVCVVDLKPNGVLELGEGGLTLNAQKKLILDGGTYKATATSTIQNGTIEATVASTIDVAAGTTLTIASPITGAANITKTGSGTLKVTGSLANYTGVITATAGVIDMTGATPITDGSLARFAGNVMINTDGTKWIKIATGVSAVPAGITFFGTTATALDQTKLFVKNDELYFGEDGAATYSFTNGDKEAMEAMAQGDIYRPTILSINNTGFDATTVPEGYFAWTDDGVVYAAKKSNSISLKTGTRTSDRDSAIRATDTNVGGFPVAGKFWNNSKVWNDNSTSHPFTEYLTLKDGNGEMTEVAVAYRAPNTYFAAYSPATLENGNQRLTASYLDDGQVAGTTQWTVEKGDEESITLPAAPNARGWQFEVSNIPYEMYDLYVYIASDVQDNVDNANSHLYACPVVISCDGENWTYYAGPSKVTDNDSWEAYGWAHAGNVVEGKNYIRFRISKNSMRLDDISTIHITHGTRNTNAKKRLGLAGIQIAEIDDDGVRDRVKVGEGTQNWHDTEAWSKKKGESTELVNWTDSDETTPITARIDADTIPEIVMDSAAVTDKLVISNTAPETDAPEKTFTISGSAALTVISTIDATAFHGRLVFTAPVNGNISLGQNAYIEVNIPANETKTVDDLIPGNLTVVGNSIKLTGSGTLLCEEELPPNDITLQDPGWTGTLYLKNLTWENWGFGAKGTANTKVKVTGVKGFGPNSTGDGAAPELILEDDDDDKALLVTNGYGGKDYFFRKVTGSGTFGWDPAVTEGPQNGHTYIFKDASGFTGVFDAGTYLKIVVGETTAGAEKGSITFANGATIKPNNWTAKKAYFGATLNLVSAAVNDVIVSGLDTDPGTLPAITVGGQPTTLVLKYENGAVKVVQAAEIEITGEASIAAINTQAGSTPAIVTIKGENAAVKFDDEPAVAIKFVAGAGATVLKFVPGNGARFVSLAETKQFTYEGFTSFKYEWAAGEVISLNFGSNENNASMTGEGKTDTFAGVQIPDASWINLTGGSGTDVAVDKFYDSDADATFDISGMTVSFGSRGGSWHPGTASTYPFMNGYLDDNNASRTSVTLKDVPFTTYDVIVYMQGDVAGRKFTPIEVTQNETSTKYTYKDDAIVIGEWVETDDWGLGDQTDISYEHNVIRITGLTGDATISPMQTTATGNRRGTLAAIQIVNTGTPLVTKWIGAGFYEQLDWDDDQNWSAGVPTEDTIAAFTNGVWLATVNVTSDSAAKLIYSDSTMVTITGYGANFGGIKSNSPISIEGDPSKDPITFAGEIASTGDAITISVDAGIVVFDDVDCSEAIHLEGNATLAGSGTIRAVTVEKDAILKPTADGFVVAGAWAQNSGAEIKPIKIDCSLITASDVESAITLISLGSDCTGIINDVTFEGGATGLVFVKSADNKSIIASKTCIWTGAGADHNWSNTANWQGGVVPMAGIPVIINLGTDAGAYTINLPDSAVQVGSLTLSGSATSFAFAGTGSLSATSYNISGLTATTIDLSKTTFNADYTIPANSTLIVNGATWTSAATFAATTSKFRYDGAYTAINGTFAGEKGTVEFGGTYNAAANTSFTDASVKYAIVGTVNVESGNFGFGTVEFSLEPGCAVTVAGNFLSGDGNGSKGYFNGGTLTANKIVIGTKGSGTGASEDYYFGDGSSANNTMVITANEIYNNYGGQSTGMHVHVRNGCTINLKSRIWSDATVNPSYRHWFLEGGKFVITDNCSILFQQLRSVTGTTEFEVADSKTLTLTVEAHGSLTKTGVIRKTGTGTIVFANNPAASFTIAAGTAIVDAGNEGTVSVDGEGSGVLKVKVAYAQWISGYNSTATVPEGKNIVFVLPDSSEIEGERNVLPPKAADRKWVGTTDSNWNVATNWEPEGVPGANDSVEIDSTDAAISIALPNGGVTVGGITFKGGNAIALTGDAINVGVVVKADAGSAEFVGGTIATSIQVVGGTLAISGDYTLPATIATESGATLELDVASAKTITSVISGAGAFKKTGAGTLTMNGLSSYTGGTTVEAGGIVFGVTNGHNVGPIGAYYTSSTTDWDYNKAVVKNGAFIDVNGKADMCYTFDLEAGAVLKNAGSTIGEGSRQTRRVALLGNATVDAVSNAFGIHNGNHNATQLALGEYTLTKIGNGAFELVNTVISGTGTIDVQAGTLWFNTRSSAMNDGTIKLGANGALQVSANATVKNLIANNTAITGNGTLIVTGLLDLSTVENNTLQAVNLTLTEGMTFKFPAGYMGESKFTLCSGTLTPASGTLNANIDFGNTIEQVQLVIADKGITFEFSDTTWTGGESGEETDWDVATNWTHGVPKASTAVTIPADANISLTSASIASSITLEGSATLTMDGVTAANIKSIAVPTGATLTINVEEGNTATVGLISGAGAVAKSGAGTLELSGANTYAGGTTIKNGVVKRTNKASFGAANSTVEVKSGASLDWGDDGDTFKNCTKYNLVIAGSGFDPNNGKTAFYYSANTGNRTLGANQRHPISLTLAGNATIGGACNFGFMNEIGNNSYAVVPVDLGGYTLTKVGTGTFYTSNLEFHNGTVEIEEGTLSVINNYSNDTFQSDAKLVVGENGHLEAFRNPFTVYDVEFTAAENTIAKNQANHLFVVKGTVVGSFTSAAKLEIAAGATIPVTSVIAASSELTLPTDGTINIDLGTAGSGNFRVITAPNGYVWDTTKITLVGSDTTDWNVSAEGTTLVVSKLPLDATVDDADGYNFGEKIIEVDVTKIDSTLTGTQIKVVTTDKNGTQVGEATLVPIDGSKGKYEVTIGGLTAGNAYNFNVTFVDSEGIQIEQSKEADLENIAVGTIIQGTELFSADATSGESDVDGGDWDTGPTITEGAYVIDDETASVFEVESTFAPEGNYTIEYDLTFEAGFTTELTAEETAPIAGITISKEETDETTYWYRANGTEWLKLDQTVEPGHYLIRMAFTDTTVTYSVKGDEDTNFVTLTQTVEETTTSEFNRGGTEAAAIQSVSFLGSSSLAKFGAKTDDTIDKTIANEDITTVEGVVAALNTDKMITLKTNVAIDTKDLAVGEYTIGGGFDLSFVGTDTRTIAYNRTTGKLVITDVVPLNEQTTKVISDLNLNPADKDDIPFVKAINSTNPNTITFKLFHGTAGTPVSEETKANANAKFFVESCDNASFTGEGVVIEKSPSVGVKETLDVPLPTGDNKVRYYRLKFNAK